MEWEAGDVKRSRAVEMAQRRSADDAGGGARGVAVAEGRVSGCHKPPKTTRCATHTSQRTPHAGLQDSGRLEGQPRGHRGWTRVVIDRHAAAELDGHVIWTAGRSGDRRPPRDGGSADGQQLAAGVAGGDTGRDVSGHERCRQPSHGRDESEARPSRDAAALPSAAGRARAGATPTCSRQLTTRPLLS